MVCIGYMGNNIYPARAGEVLRSYVLKRERGVSHERQPGHGGHRAPVRRPDDVAVRVRGAAVRRRRVSRVCDDYGGFVVVLHVLFLGALGVFLLLAARPDLARRVYEPLARLLLPERFRTPVLEAADRFMFGLDSLARGREVFMIFGTSVLVWLFETMKYWFVMHAFPFAVSFLTLMLMNGVVNLATTMPAAPGYVGHVRPARHRASWSPPACDRRWPPPTRWCCTWRCGCPSRCWAPSTSGAHTSSVGQMRDELAPRRGRGADEPTRGRRHEGRRRGCRLRRPGGGLRSGPTRARRDGARGGGASRAVWPPASATSAGTGRSSTSITTCSRPTPTSSASRDEIGFADKLITRRPITASFYRGPGVRARRRDAVLTLPGHARSSIGCAWAWWSAYLKVTPRLARAGERHRRRLARRWMGRRAYEVDLGNR